MQAEKKPWEAFIVGFLYSSVALFLSLWIFRQQASLVMIFLTSLAAVPLIYNTIKVEEKKDICIDSESTLLKEHRKAVSVYLYLFLGFIISFALWYAVLPASLLHDLFRTQTQTILDINNRVTGRLSSESLILLSTIFLNNVKVLIFCILFAFLYGFGAIFILTWNASVISTAIGNFIRINLANSADLVGLTKVGKYLHIVSLGLFKYAIHGIPEIVAYIIAGITGGIISVAVIKHDFGTRKFENIVLDTSSLLMLALGLLVIAAVLEVYVTPLFFLD
jgi:uncharacterized membrane protein SpoIIM required for sporulation